jgi:D-xylose transport system permease protein
MFDFFGIPSFVVTLAGLLAWQGFQLRVLGNTGTVNITDPKITGLTDTFYSDTVGWISRSSASLGSAGRASGTGGPVCAPN